MYTVTYYKMGHRWYLDLPDYIHRGGNPEHLERFGSFHEFLEMAAAGDTTVVFQMDTAPFGGADVLELTGSSGGQTGGYYRLRTYNGAPADMELWFNQLIYEGQSRLPQHIYLKRVAPSDNPPQG